MLVEIIRPLHFSMDGIHPQEHQVGSRVDLPDRHAPGLIAEGYCRPVTQEKAIGATPENKALFATEEDKGELIFSVGRDDVTVGGASESDPPRRRRRSKA